MRLFIHSQTSIEQLLYPTLYQSRGQLSMMRLKLAHVTEGGSLWPRGDIRRIGHPLNAFGRHV